jgi:outer membrane protein OmpA-like peptidoglycan-associated protein
MCSVFFTATSKNSCVVLGLTNGDLYDFTAYATNKLGTGPTSEPSNEVTPLPTPSVVVDPSRVVVPSTSSTVATCSAGVDTLTACSVVARANNGTVIASGSSGTVTSTPSVPVVLTVTARGAALAVPVGGITARVVATITTTGDVTEQVTSLVTLVAVNQQYTFSDASLFTGSSTKFSAKGSAQIGTFAKKLTGSKLVVCDGYTDNVGSVTADKALALDRARSVCTAFRSQTQKIEFVSFGQLHPVASNRTAAGRARNNRVVVKITN